MTRRLAVLALMAGLSGCATVPGMRATKSNADVVLPGMRYKVIRSGPVAGVHPTRADAVEMRYTGRLRTGEVFSTSADGGDGTSRFDVRNVVPGVSAALQLMRPGDLWRITVPAYLAYGAPGRRYRAPEATLKRDVPPDSILVFDLELVAIRPPAR